MKDNFKGKEDHYVNFEEFVHRLKIPADDYTFTLFRMFVHSNDVAQDVIDFREYLLHALMLIKIQEAKVEFVKTLFMVSVEVEK